MHSNNTIFITKHEDVIRRVEELRSRSDELKSKLGYTLKQLWNGERDLGEVNDLSIFTGLKTRFPNFREVIEYFESNAIALHHLGMPFEANPVLLIGEPGLGKTLFVSELAKAMALPFFDISMNTMSASFALTGGNLQWGDASVGFIAKSLAGSPVANPVIMIDEIDKSKGSPHYNPINAFYSLLEKHSAQRFKDEALEIEMDVSRVIWVLTGNYIEDIPVPILSRMKIFTIKQPEIEDMPAVIQSIFLKIRDERAYGKAIASELDESVINRLVDLQPRQVRMALEDAVLTAIMQHRYTVQVTDIKSQRKEKRHGIGFTA